MTGYVRNDVANNIADGNIINASDLDGEFDAVQAAFNAATGHTHDGTTGEGAPITVVGPTQDVVATATTLRPKTDDTVDLGTPTLEFKDLYIDGVANIDSLVADTADINGGTIDNVTIGGASAGAGTFTTVTTSGNLTVNGNTTLGNAATDTVIITADIASNIIPSANDAYDLGASGSEWKDLYVDGTANIDSLIADTADINGGTIDGATIATSDITVGAGKTLDVSGGTLTLANDQISGDKIQGGTIGSTTITTLTSTTSNITTVNATTVDTTNIEVTNIKAKDGTASATIADSTGVMTVASSVLTTTDINGGTIDGVTIGGASAGAGTFTTLTATGNVTLGNAATDTVTVTADVASNLIPSVDNTYDLGAVGSEWKDLYIDGTANIDSLVADTADINGGTIDGVTLGTNSAITELQVDNLNLNGNTISSTNTNGNITLDPNGTGVTDVVGVIRSDGADLDGAVVINESGADVDFRVESDTQANALFVDGATGNVGVGTSSPANKLDVALPSNAGSVLFYGGTQSDRGLKISNSNTGGFDNSAWEINASADNSGSILMFKTRNAERLRIDSSGNVGIGTSSPLGIGGGVGVHVNEANNPALRLTNSTTGATASDGSAIFVGNAASAGAASLNVYNYESAPIAFFTNATERLRITSTGNVGIGTSSPASLLDVRGAAPIADTGMVRLQSSETTAVGPAYTLQLNRQNSTTGALLLGADNSSNAAISVNGSASLRFGQEVSGTYTERLRITSTGNVGIGTSSPDGKLHVSSGLSGKTYSNSGSAFIVENSGTASGFYVFRVSTAGAQDAFNVTNSGNVLIGTETDGASKLRIVGLPTSSAGLSAGDVWNDGGTLKIA